MTSAESATARRRVVCVRRAWSHYRDSCGIDGRLAALRTVEERRSLAADTLLTLGYPRSQLVTDYPVWLGSAVLLRADTVAFGRESPLDMTTATAVVEIVQSGSNELAGARIAQALAAPLLLTFEPDAYSIELVGVAQRREQIVRAGYETPIDVGRWAQSLGPRELMEVKVGHRQLAMWSAEFSLVESAQRTSAQLLAPLVEAALATAAEMSRGSSIDMPGIDSAERLHRQAARIVVGALTALTLRDKEELTDLSVGALADASQQRFARYFQWLQSATPQEHGVFEATLAFLGEGINYRSLSPRVLAAVYESSLVSEAHRKALATHYTPPGLARRIAATLPLEQIPPSERRIMDPTCGSGNLLLAAHDRLRDLSAGDGEPGISSKILGFDADPFAVEITRLSLLLNAYPGGDDWKIDQADILNDKARGTERPNVIISNPPWMNANTEGRRTELADRFLRWMMRTLPSEGLLAIVLPVGWLSSRASSETRASLSELFDVVEVWRLPEGVFESSAMGPAVLFAQRFDDAIRRKAAGARIYKRVMRKDRLAEFYGSGRPEELSISEVHADESMSALFVSGPLHTHFAARRRVTTLGSVADVYTGPQPVSGLEARRARRNGNVRYLSRASHLPQFGEAAEEALLDVAFPDDFQGGSSRGERGLVAPKVLVSAARAPDNPWRLRVGFDSRGILVRNSMQMVLPRNPDRALGLMALLGSGFASAWIDEIVPDRNISTADLRSIPVPTSLRAWRQLGQIGQKLLNAQPLSPLLLKQLEDVIWKIMNVPADIAAAVAGRLAGFPAPEGAPRYIQSGIAATPGDQVEQLSTYGVLIEHRAYQVKVVAAGLTSAEGDWVRTPHQLTGWMLRPGATFVIEGTQDADLFDASLHYHRFDWMADEELPQALGHKDAS
jgi:hypothetical protein